MVNVKENPPAAAGGDGPRTPEQVVHKVIAKTLSIHPVPEKALEEYPDLAGKFELEMVGYFRDPKSGKVTDGGGLMLHTGSEEECKQLYPIARTILHAIGAEVITEMMALVERQVGSKAIINHAASKVIVGAGGHAARCASCGKLKPCGCISAKRR